MLMGTMGAVDKLNYENAQGVQLTKMVCSNPPQTNMCDHSLAEHHRGAFNEYPQYTLL